MKRSIYLITIFTILASVSLLLLACIPTHKHNLEYVESKSPSCFEPGNIGYWHCIDCNGLFSDAEGKNEVSPGYITIPATNHSLIHHESHDATCISDGNIEYWECELCHYLFSDAEATNALGYDEIVIKGHILTHFNAALASCTENGNIEYWECELCNKYFSNPNCENEIIDKNSVTILGGHSLSHVPAVAHTCYTNGNIEYWQCSVCSKCFENSDASIECDNITDYASHEFDNATSCSVCGFNGTVGVTYIPASDGDGYSVASVGNATASDIIISCTYNYKPVISIEPNAFENCTSVNSIVIPDSVKTIGFAAFYNCTNLQRISIPFVGEKYDGSGKTNFGYIFGASNANYNSSYVPASLATVEISSETDIDNSAFKNCSTITTLYLNKVNNIGADAFSDCKNLSAVYINSIDDWCNISFENRWSNPFYYAQDLYLNNTLTTEIELPDNLGVISNYAFYNFKNVTKFVLPVSLSSIGNSAFANCEGITEINIPSSILNISSSTFENCTSLTSVIIPASVIRISPSAFNNCDSLNQVYYTGDASSWRNITIDYNNTPVTNATKYYYSESNPYLGGYDGYNYWHYDTDNVTPIIWY